MRALRRISITHQATIFLMMVLLTGGAVLYFWAIDNSVKSELAHSKTVADLADSFRTLAARHGSLYVRRESAADVGAVGRYLASFDAHSQQADGSVKDYVFHQKNPFLALADLSDVVSQSPAEAKFSMASDNPMNPANLADIFELTALQKMRAENLSESWAVDGTKLRYVRALIATKACLACHGNPEDAPYAVKTQYRAPIGSARGGGYGYVEGEIVGVTSVRIPHRSPLAMLVDQGPYFWIAAVSFASLVFFGYIGVIRGLVIPLQRLTRFSTEIAESTDLKRIKAPVFDPRESSSSNELHQQSHALKSLYESMRAAMEHLNGSRK